MSCPECDAPVAEHCPLDDDFWPFCSETCWYSYHEYHEFLDGLDAGA